MQHTVKKLLKKCSQHCHGLAKSSRHGIVPDTWVCMIDQCAF